MQKNEINRDLPPIVSAMDSGFNNVRSFYRIFRDKYGMTPSEYRNALKKE